MPIRTLKALIQASGYAGVAGQSFRNHVVGAVTGARLSDYFLSSWSNFVGGPSHDPINHNLIHSSGSSHSFTFMTQGGSRWRYIKRPPSEWTLESAAEVDPGTATGIVDLVTITEDSNQTHSVTFRLFGQQVIYGPAGPVAIGKNWFANYDSNEIPPNPDGSIHEEWVISAYAPVANPAGQWDTITYRLKMPADLGNFNDELEHYFTADVARSAGPTPTTWFQWHGNSAFTSLLSDEPEVRFYVHGSNSSGYVFLRYSTSGPNGPWQTYGNSGGVIAWDDPRSNPATA